MHEAYRSEVLQRTASSSSPDGQGRLTAPEEKGRSEERPEFHREEMPDEGCSKLTTSLNRQKRKCAAPSPRF